MVCEWLLDRAGIQAPCFCSELLSRASFHMSIKSLFIRLGDIGFLCWVPFQRNSCPHSRFIPSVGVPLGIVLVDLQVFLVCHSRSILMGR